MTIPESTIAYWDGLDRWGRELDAPNQRRVRETIGLVPSDVRTVLDIGAGDGTVSNPLASRGLHTAGIDVSIVALRHFAGARCVAATDAIPFAEASHDLVICAEVLEHLPDGVLERALAEIERVARRYIIVTTPNEEYLPAGYIRCAACGSRYHMNLHLRTFDRRAHRSLFSRFRHERTVGIEAWRHHPVLTRLQHALFGVYRQKEGVLCPHCGATGCASARLRPASRVALKALRRAAAHTGRSKPRWIASLYSATP